MSKLYHLGKVSRETKDTLLWNTNSDDSTNSVSLKCYNQAVPRTLIGTKKCPTNANTGASSCFDIDGNDQSCGTT